MIDQLAQFLLQHRAVPMASLIVPLRHREDASNPNVVKAVVDRDGYALYFSRAAIPFERSGTGDRGHGTWEVYTHGGRTATGKDAIAWVKQAEKLGAGEILLTSMDADGTKNGYDIALTDAVCQAVNIPVIASGGAGQLEDFYAVFAKTGADAALAASVFHYREFSVGEVKSYLKEKKVEVRL